MAQNYTRQSSFADGDTITASLFNNEYNQLVNAFAYSSTDVSATGHRHDGSIGQGGNIAQIGDLDFNNKIVVDGTNNRWGFFVEVAGASVEQIRLQDGSIIPVTTNDIDLGSASLQFKDAYFDGTVNADSLVLSSGATVTVILDEDAMTSNSATALATQQSIKAYVDSQVTAQDLDFQGDSGGALSIDLDSETLTIAGGTGIDTSGAINTLTVSIDSTVATLTGTQTLTNKTLTSPDINGGTIDGAVIGATTAAAGSFTTVAASGNITVGGTVDGRDVAADGTKLDGIESGATADQTAAEIRALVEAATDSNVFTDADHTKLNGIEALADVTDTTNVTAAGALMDSELTNITAVKALNQGVATTDSPSFAGLTATTADINGGTIDGTVIGGSSAAAGTFTSITGTSANINGTVTADGLTVESGGSISTSGGTTVSYRLDANRGTDDTNQGVRFGYAGIDAYRTSVTLAFSQTAINFTQTGSDGTRTLGGFTSDGDFQLNNLSSAAKFFWDASAESLGIGTTSPGNTLDLRKDTPAITQTSSSAAYYTTIGTNVDFTKSFVINNKGSEIVTYADDTAFGLHLSGGAGDLIRFSTNSTERMRIDSSGNVGIGASSPATIMHVNSGATADPTFRLQASSLTSNIADFKLDTTNDRVVLSSSSIFPLAFNTNNTERMRIDSSGNVGIGTSSPSTQFHVLGASPVALVQASSGDGILQLQCADGSTGYSTVRFGDNIDGDVGKLEYYHGNNSMLFYTNTAERMRIDSAGNLLVGGTTSIYNDTNRGLIEINGSANSLLALNVGGAEAGYLYHTASNLNLWNTKAGYLRFATNNTERLRIDSAGNVGIGKTSGGESQASGSGYWFVPGVAGYFSHIQTVDTGNYMSYYNRIGTTNGGFFTFSVNDSNVGSVTSNGTSTAYNITSDYRLKEDVQDMVGATDRVMALKPCNFAWKSTGERVDGFLAHEAQAVVPEAVHGVKDAMRTEEYEVSPAVLDEDGNVVTEAVMGTREVPDYQGIDQSKLVPLLTKALQEALQRIEALEAKLA